MRRSAWRPAPAYKPTRRYSSRAIGRAAGGSMRGGPMSETRRGRAKSRGRILDAAAEIVAEMAPASSLWTPSRKGPASAEAGSLRLPQQGRPAGRHDRADDRQLARREGAAAARMQGRRNIEARLSAAVSLRMRAGTKDVSSGLMADPGPKPVACWTPSGASSRRLARDHRTPRGPGRPDRMAGGGGPRQPRHASASAPCGRQTSRIGKASSGCLDADAPGTLAHGSAARQVDGRARRDRHPEARRPSRPRRCGSSGRGSRPWSSSGSATRRPPWRRAARTSSGVRSIRPATMSVCWSTSSVSPWAAKTASSSVGGSLRTRSGFRSRVMALAGTCLSIALDVTLADSR